VYTNIIIICFNTTNAIINNYYGSAQGLILLFSYGHAKEFLRNLYEKIGQAPSKGFASPDPGTDRPHCTSYGDQYLDWRFGLVFVCPSRLPEDGTPVPKDVVVYTCHELHFIECL